MIKLNSNTYEIENKDIKHIFKERDFNSNKGTYGSVGIMGGSLEYSGSIKLANMSAVATRAGCGLVRVIVPKNIANIIAPYLLEQTLCPIDYTNKDTAFKKLQDILGGLKSLAVGMGFGNNDYKDILIKIIKNYKGNLIIDADGLNILSNIDLNILKETKAKIVLTPHIKEFSRLTKLSIDEIKQNKESIALSFAKKYNIILLLKDYNTIITDGKDVYVTTTGTPGMATAGSGDVLSGILVSILGYNEANLLTVSSASYLAGVAGSMASCEYTDIAMVASDTIKYIGDAIKYIRKN